MIKDDQIRTTNDHLVRCYEILNRESCFSNPAKKQYIVPPEISFQGKKTKINNIEKITEIIGRDINIVHDYMQKELHTQINIQADKSFVIVGRFKLKNIEKVLKNFIVSNIQCKMCRSLSTVIGREEKINMMHCNNCKAERAIN
jgi:translation initiation factor 2 beta subunit (eIF-2beta)/eIF-5